MEKVQQHPILDLESHYPKETVCLQEQFIIQYTADSYKLIVEDDIYSAHYTTVECVVLSCQKTTLLKSS